MALDFPTSPSPNQVYTAGAKSWSWDNTSGAWLAVNAGIQGTQGTQGTLGTQGAQGLQGITGANGSNGSQGTQGIQGLLGIQGAQGTQGEQGIQGIQGIQGTQGTQGIQGLKGTKITPGDTAPASPSENDLWWDSTNGILMVYYNDGTSAQWVTANSGIAGEQGIQGTQGTQGVQGTQGTQGIQGLQGVQGTQGTQGVQGIQGITGLAFTIAKTYLSVAALTADTSPTAIVAGQFALINTTNVEDAENSRLYIWTGSAYTFVDDLSGSAGIQGITGSQGVQGIQGIQGIQGTQGIQGIQGIQGTQGTQGIQGISGASILGTANTWTNTNAFTSVTATTGTFTGAVTVDPSSGISIDAINNAATYALRIRRTNTTNRNWGMYVDSGGLLKFDDITGAVTPLSLSATGAAITGTLSATGNTITFGSNSLTLTDTYFGYSGNTYKVLRVGTVAASRSVALCVDPSAVTGGSFSGTGQILIGNNTMLAPNGAGTDWIGVLRATSGTVVIGPSTSSGELVGGVAGTATFSSTGLAVTGMATVTSSGSVAVDVAQTAIKASGQYGGGIALLDTNYCGFYAQSAGADLRIYTNVAAGSAVATGLRGVFSTTGLAVTGNLTVTGGSISGLSHTVQVFTTGSGTYTTPAGVKAIRVRLVGAGAGGGASAGSSDGTAGGNTTFGSMTGNGGALGQAGRSYGGLGGLGGTSSGGDLNIAGSDGQSGGRDNGSPPGGGGGASFFGGAGRGGITGAVGTADAEGKNAQGAGSGGGGGGGASGSLNSAGGGGAGGFSEKLIHAPSATYSYAIGAKGTGGPAGSWKGGDGAAGLIHVEEFYS